ncbi:MAG: hypothetical protein II998_09840 [Clostridia bacterium]|nr:hypothetical protein [Clostridia bacterium]
MTRNDVLNGALMLNGADKNYTVSVENDTIITEVKWMDATFFAPGSVTDEIRNFKYIVRLHNGNKWSEIDEKRESSTSLNAKGINKHYSYTKGHTITFNRTVGIGQDRNNNVNGVVDVRFNSEDYKRPVREYLMRCGYKKKMGSLAKTFIIGGILALVLTAAILAFLFFTGIFTEKDALSSDEFIKEMESEGMVIEDYYEYNDDSRDCDYYAYNDDYTNVRFIDWKTEKQCKEYFEERVEYCNNSNYSKITSRVSGTNYARVEMRLSDGIFVIISYIDDTMIICDTSVRHKDQSENARRKDKLKKLVDRLGY